MIGIFVFILAEIIVFILIGKLIGFLLAFFLIILSAIFGFLLLHSSGLKLNSKRLNPIAYLFSLQKNLHFPFYMIAGFLFILPGFISDLLGLFCLIPYTRQLLTNRILHSIMIKVQSKQNFYNRYQKSKTPKYSSEDDSDHRTLEGEFWDKKKDTDPSDKK